MMGSLIESIRHSWLDCLLLCTICLIVMWCVSSTAAAGVRRGVCRFLWAQFVDNAVEKWGKRILVLHDKPSV